MIFCTLGTQLPFDRLLKIVDDAAVKLPDIEFFAQIADSTYVPKNIRWEKEISESEYHSILAKSKLIIGHAGMGTIISALDYDIPLIMLPREFKLGEHRNDHQLATAKRFCTFKGITVLQPDDNLAFLIRSTLSNKVQPQSMKAKDSKLDELCRNINDVIKSSYR
ncbi:glycosyltransferase [Vibrio sp. 05-20-BW147]|uniref:glycosyltransferase n=1 Tax=Vibrio sp. 05-20-BW147 TaxID=2575834 RepID=UPI0015935442